MAKDLKEQIEIMTHYLNGGEIEFSDDNFKTAIGEANKKDDGDLCWDWHTFDYRIKEQKQKVTIEKWLCKSGKNSFYIYIHEGTDSDGLEKVKLLETYEVEL